MRTLSILLLPVMFLACGGSSFDEAQAPLLSDPPDAQAPQDGATDGDALTAHPDAGDATSEAEGAAGGSGGAGGQAGSAGSAGEPQEAGGGAAGLGGSSGAGGLAGAAGSAGQAGSGGSAGEPPDAATEPPPAQCDDALCVAHGCSTCGGTSNCACTFVSSPSDCEQLCVQTMGATSWTFPTGFYCRCLW
jgi:hypothetical protein